MSRHPLIFTDSLGHPVIVDASQVVLVRPALKPTTDGSHPKEIEEGIVALILNNRPEALFVQGEFSVIANNVFGQ